MKQIILIIILLLLIVFQTNSQEKEMNQSQLSKELILVENAFAETTRNATVRDGFLKFIAEDGILFRPAPVNGKEFLEDSEAKPGLLLWYPTYSIISSSGDFGVNSGPWEYKQTEKDEAVAFGQFITVWEKQYDGIWKFLIDIGISHPKPEESEEGIDNSFIIEKFKNEKNYNDVLRIEKDFSSAPLKDSYKPIVNYETTFLRNNREPISGKFNDEFLSQLNGITNWETLGGKASIDNELAYTYGKGSALDNEMNTIYEFYYLHVWINENGNWKLLFDVINEIPDEE